MVVAANGVAVDQITVQVKQLHVTLAHTAPVHKTQISLNGDNKNEILIKREPLVYTRTQHA